MKSAFLQRLKLLPIALPIVAVFHIVWLGIGIWRYASEPFPDKIWTQVAWLALYCAFWLSITWGNRWAVNAYIVLTALNLILHFLIKDESLKSALTDALFPIDLLCSFLLLVFYRRLPAKGYAPKGPSQK